MLKVAEGVLSNSVAIMRTMKQKAIDAANDTNTNADRAIIQKELDQHIDQLNDNALVTFNGRYLFDGSADHTYSNEQTIIAALNTEWIANSLELIERSTGLGFEKGDPSVTEITVNFVDSTIEAPGWEFIEHKLAYVSSYVAPGEVLPNKLELSINMKYYKDLIKDDVNGASTGTSAYLDRVIAHEMTHAVMSANISGFAALGSTFIEGAAEVIHGIDDERGTLIKSLADSQSIASSIRTPVTGGNSDATDNDYAAGYVMFRYMAAQSGFSAEKCLTNFMQSLAQYRERGIGTDQVNAAISAATKGKFTSFEDLKKQIAADEQANADAGGNGSTFLAEYCDIILDNKDTGAITGRDAGVSRVNKTAKTVVPEAGSVQFWTNPDSDYTVINGLKVNWPMEYVQVKGGLYFQIGTKAAQNIHAVFSNVDAQALGLQDKDGKNISVQNQGDASNAISQLDHSIERALNQLTRIGALHSRLEYTNDNIITASENVTSAESVIRDADMAKEMADYTKNSVLLQAAQAMLSQANQSSSTVLSLLQ